MKNKKTLVVNPADNTEQTFINDLPAVENVITAYLTSIQISNIHDAMTRDKYRKKAVYGKASVSVGNFAAQIMN